MGWDKCAQCDRRPTDYLCSQCNDGVFICKACYDRHKEQNIEKLKDLSDKSTILSLINGAAVSLQIPSKSVQNLNQSNTITTESKQDNNNDDDNNNDTIEEV